MVLDDIGRIEENPDIRLAELTADNLLKAAFGEKSAKARPVGNISFALNYYYHHYKVRGYHVVNIIIHILTDGRLMVVLIKA